jgi:hypothetical protein
VVPAVAPQVEPDTEAIQSPSSQGKGLLYMGIGMAAVALLVCTGVSGYVWDHRSAAPDAPVSAVVALEEPTVATAEADATAEAPSEEAVAEEPSFEAQDTGSPRGAKPSKAQASAAPTAPGSRTSRSAPRPARRAQRTRPPQIPSPALPPTVEETTDEGDGAVDLDRAARRASGGGLEPSTRRSLESVGTDNPTFTRARTILAVDAARRGDARSAENYIEQTMALPENRYNPVLLSQLALHQVNRQRYRTALTNANKAEQHWARLPSDVMFERKAVIYEVQAAATQGLLYEANEDRVQLELANDALRRWARLREHATAGSSFDRVARADRQIEKLNSIRARLE